MTPEERTENQSLAERLTKYSDTIVTASIVGLAGLGLAIADADIRPSIESSSTTVLTVAAVAGSLFLWVLVILRRWELILKTDLPEQAKSRGFSRSLHIARMAIVAFALVASVLLALDVR